MAYDLHIEHSTMTPDGEPEPIPLTEWRDAVAATEGVRLFAGEVHTSTIPRGVIRIRATEGDAEVWFSRDGRWNWAFRWQEGSVAFPARFEPGDASHPVWAAAVKLASRLSAVIRGDEGETYDLQTGRVIPR
jgi:hypothetical protein